MNGRQWSLGLLGVLLAVCGYRAFTQSITFDEALTWELYIAGPVSNLFRHFDANHHFLNSVLMRLSTGIFGVSEWSLRLPALAGAGLFFYSVHRLCWNAFAGRLMPLMAIAAVTLNPLVLDFMVAARGYGLGLALWMWALAALYECVTAPMRPGIVALAGTALGLSISANLIYAPPAVGLAAIAAVLLKKRRPAAPPNSKKRQKEAPKPDRGWLILPASMAGVLVLFALAAPLEAMHTGDFYTGAPTIAQSLRSLAAVSVLHSGPLRGVPMMHPWRDALAFAIAPAVLFGGLVVAAWKRNSFLALAAGPAVFSALALWLIHEVAGRPYPEDRTGLYFLPAVTLALAGIGSSAPKSLVWIARGLAAVLILQFALEFNTRKFLVWEYDADTRAVGDAIEQQRAGRSTVRVGGSWQLQQSLLFYGFQHNRDWMELRRETPIPSGLDYYALIPADQNTLERLNLIELYRGSVSGSVLGASR